MNILWQEQFLRTEDAAAWQRMLPASQSVFGSRGYARICERFRGVEARLHVLQSNQGALCHPMLLRPLAELPFANGVAGRWDAATPDYTGPMVRGDLDITSGEFQATRKLLMQREGIVAEFAHLHPWSNAAELLGQGCSHNRDVVWVDVTQTPNELYRDSFEHACRKNIQKATREGVKTFISNTDEHLQEFHRIYTDTMRRNQALDSYCFSLDFFRAFRDELAGNARFVFATQAGRLIAATLYLHDDTDVYSYLGGADAAFHHLRPTNMVVWDTIQWAHDTHRRRLVLGGGYRPNDGIFRFKATFSRLRQPFYIYRKIHLEHEYAQLEYRARTLHGLTDNNVAYFPSYRNRAVAPDSRPAA